ncbi:TlyA family RNA methyltransferase [Clostridium sp. Cult2]|uniref:TlyA family RNA methyltransferase n=1 Tax=Clostridium sp. Cult2 TaxID=2079003 RepID=UPI001F3301F6|nr:TlyA family RNA methyltransferase [Clostridium sp. Cult2]MCF6465879.1 TlyA family rRNA (cytidine-2'-O)-methyltransferase [Clostridium sp. Cult2]
MEKKRADILLFEKGMVSSREKARRIIMEGVVFVGNRRVDKPGEKVNIDSDITIKENPIHYVSRGGLKLEKAIEIFNIDLEGKIAIDIGASTGGFTDCMLKNGVKKVYAIDVGYGQLDWNLRNDSRVIVKERTNIRYVTKDDIGELVDFISIDVSFISLKLVLPVAKELLTPNGCIMALIKPQFEAGKNKVGKKGLVKDKMVHKEVIENMVEFCNTIQMDIVDLGFSPITGSTGNIEFLSYILKSNDNNIVNEEKILKTIESAHNSLYH